MTTAAQPKIVVLAGPNGAGKSTVALQLLTGALGVQEFVNADTIAHGLSAFAPQRVAIAAGRIMLDRLHQLASTRAHFAFETTLASRSFAPWLSELREGGYFVHLVFLWLPSAEMAIARVAERVRSGGHDVPPDTILRRYERGLHNLRTLYRPLADRWRVLDNSMATEQRIVAAGRGVTVDIVRNPIAWSSINSDK